MRVRAARVDEVAGLEDLQRRASLVWEDQREDVLAHPDCIEVSVEAIRENRVRVAEEAGRPLGFSVVLPAVDAVVELDGLFVEPDAMRTGIGARLLADVVEHARRQGVVRVEVTANPRAAGFYRKSGFVGDAAARTRFGPGLRLHLDLAP